MRLSATAKLLPRPLRPAVRAQVVRWRCSGLRDDDVLLVSYPKSGSTWLRFLLAHALTSEPPDFDSVRDSVPPLDRYRRTRPLLPDGGRLVRSHEPLVPYRGRRGQRIIHLVRDGRDVSLSYLAHEQRYGRFSGTPTEFIDRFLAGSIDHYGPWHRHVSAGLDLEGSSTVRVLRVRYEDLRAQTLDELERILAFCGVRERPVDSVPLQEVVAHNGKEQMRAKEGSSAFLAQMRTDGTPFVRPDQRARWDDLLPASVRTRFEHVCGPALVAAGYGLREEPVDGSRVR